MTEKLGLYEMEELMELAAHLAARFTGCDSTSMTYERAQSLMGAVVYTLEAYNRWQKGDLAAGKVSARAAYQAGYQLILEKMGELVHLVEAILADFEDYGLLCLRDTVREGLPEFLQRYDARFAPQETLLTLDYPLMAAVEPVGGVATVSAYAACISCEQRFLHGFPQAYVRAVLETYQADYALLVENIGALVLQNVLGHGLLQKPLSEQGFDRRDYARLGKMLSDAPLRAAKARLYELTMALVERAYGGDEALAYYLGQGVADIAYRAKAGAAHGHLERVFWL